MAVATDIGSRIAAAAPESAFPRQVWAWNPRGQRLGSRSASPPHSAGVFLDVGTDLAEVFRLGTAKVKENLAFRRYLSAQHYAHKQFQILASEVQQQVDCTACANCCRHTVVSVNKSEIENIAGHIGTAATSPNVAVGTHSLGGRPSSLARWAALCPIIYNALERYKPCAPQKLRPRRNRAPVAFCNVQS